MSEVDRYAWTPKNPSVMKQNRRGVWVIYREHAAIIRKLEAEIRKLKRVKR